MRARVELIPLYYYGELVPEEEDQVEEHIARLRRLRGRDGAAARPGGGARPAQPGVPPLLLEDCRADLMAAVQGGAPRAGRPAKGPLGPVSGGHGRDAVRRWGALRQPVGAVALMAIGFFAARLYGELARVGLDAVAGALADERLRDRALGATRQFRARADRLRRNAPRVVPGAPTTSNIQRLLLAAAHDDNAAVRVESVDLLKNRPGSSEVRDALLNAVSHDPNAGVRLKAWKA